METLNELDAQIERHFREIAELSESVRSLEISSFQRGVALRITSIARMGTDATEFLRSSHLQTTA